MASPIKAGSSPLGCVVIDAYIAEYRPTAEILAVLDNAGQDPPLLKTLAIRAVAADRQRPKYRRLGMRRIAWFYNVTERTLYRWWVAYQKGGVDALQRPTENLGRPPKVSMVTLGETRDKLLARNAQAEAARNIEAAKEAMESKAKEAKEAGGAGVGAGKGGKKAGAGRGSKKAEGAGTPAGAPVSAECLACLIAAGLAPAGEWYVGGDGIPRPGRRGWRQRPGGAGVVPEPRQRQRPARCKCKGACTMPSGRKRRNCKCEPGKPCRCACCEPLDMPPLGPPHVKGCPALVTAPPHSLTPKEFGDEIEKVTGVRYSKSHLYALLAALRLSPKTPTMTHVNRASRRNVLRWQRRVRKRIDKLRERGYTVVAVDEAFLVYNTIRGRKHWTLVGKRVPQLRTGSHKRAAPHCGYAEDGRHLTCFFARANSYTFIEFLKRLTAKFGKVAVIADQYSAHYSYVVREFIKKNRRERPDRDIQMVRFPVGCPYLNVVEQCWNRLKRAVVVGEHHATFEDLRRAASKFMGTARFNFALADYLYAKPPPDITDAP